MSRYLTSRELIAQREDFEESFNRRITFLHRIRHTPLRNSALWTTNLRGLLDDFRSLMWLDARIEDSVNRERQEAQEAREQERLFNHWWGSLSPVCSLE